jgi:hypothetical protein
MGANRRVHERIVYPLDGQWRGASGGNRCRVGDISMGGCFIFSLSVPTRNERTVVTIELSSGQTIALPGEIVYVEPSMGFGVRFDDLDEGTRRDLTALIDHLRAQRALA